MPASKKNKKKETREAIARARAWAIKRRESNNSGTSGSTSNGTIVLQDQKKQDKKQRENINLLTIMLVKEKRTLAETKMKIKLIECELDKLK